METRSWDTGARWRGTIERQANLQAIKLHLNISQLVHSTLSLPFGDSQLLVQLNNARRIALLYISLSLGKDYSGKQ